GYYQEGMTSITLEGIEGTEKIAQMMATHRDQKPTPTGGLRVEKGEDYLESQRATVLTDECESIDLPKDDVFQCLLENDRWLCLRPSGTEPKINCYYGVREDSAGAGHHRPQTLKEDLDSRLHAIVDSKHRRD